MNLPEELMKALGLDPRDNYTSIVVECEVGHVPTVTTIRYIFDEVKMTPLTEKFKLVPITEDDDG